MLTEKVIVVSCPNCRKRNEIPLRMFYDGYEGPIFCATCQEELQVDVEEE
jgi:hypothetical protein